MWQLHLRQRDLHPALAVVGQEVLGVLVVVDSAECMRALRCKTAPARLATETPSRCCTSLDSLAGPRGSRSARPSCSLAWRRA